MLFKFQRQHPNMALALKEETIIDGPDEEEEEVEEEEQQESAANVKQEVNSDEEDEEKVDDDLEGEERSVLSTCTQNEEDNDLDIEERAVPSTSTNNAAVPGQSVLIARDESESDDFDLAAFIKEKMVPVHPLVPMAPPRVTLPVVMDVMEVMDAEPISGLARLFTFHARTKTARCCLCDYISRREVDVAVHLIREHPDETGDCKKCAFCTIVAQTPQFLPPHMILAHRRKKQITQVINRDSAAAAAEMTKTAKKNEDTLSESGRRRCVHEWFNPSWRGIVSSIIVRFQHET
jgi:hypothetical protein